MLKIIKLATDLSSGCSRWNLDVDKHQFRDMLDSYFYDDPCDPIKTEGQREEMDTFGALVDKLAIVTTRMWHAQDDLYRYRRMDDKEWDEEFKDSPQKVRNTLVRACELNLQRNQLIDEIDKLFTEVLSMDENERKKLFQPKHKLY